MKKILAIILVVAMVFSMTACAKEEPTPTPAPVVTPAPATATPTPATPAPTVEPTVEPEETETPSGSDYVYLKPTVGLSDDSPIVNEWDGTEDIADGYYKVTMSEHATATDVEYADSDFAGTLYIYGGSETNTNLTVNMPNAHVEFFGKAKEVTATTSANTFVAKLNATIKTKLTVAGGNAEIQNTTPEVEIPATNTTKTTITTTNKAAPVVTNDSEGTVVVTEGASKVTISGASTAATYVKQNSTESAEVTDKTTSTTKAAISAKEVIIPPTPTITVGTDGSENTVTNAIEVVKPEVDSTELTVDDVKFTDGVGIIPLGYTLTIAKNFIFAENHGTDVTLKNYGTIALEDAMKFTSKGNIVNNGTISAEAGVTFDFSTNDNTITNNGTIAVCDEAGLRAAVAVGGNITVDGTIDLSGYLEFTKDTNIKGTENAKITMTTVQNNTQSMFFTQSNIKLSISNIAMEVPTAVNGIWVRETPNVQNLAYTSLTVKDCDFTAIATDENSTATAIKVDGGDKYQWNEIAVISGNTFDGLCNNIYVLDYYVGSEDLTKLAELFNGSSDLADKSIMNKCFIAYTIRNAKVLKELCEASYAIYIDNINIGTDDWVIELTESVTIPSYITIYPRNDSTQKTNITVKSGATLTIAGDIDDNNKAFVVEIEEGGKLVCGETEYAAAGTYTYTNGVWTAPATSTAD